MHPFPPAAAGGTLRGVPCRASPLDGRGLDTLQGNSHPQSLPLGGRTVRGTVRSGPGEATINHRWAGAAGSDEGAIWYPTFPCRKGEALVSRPGGIFLLPRWASRSPPHPSPSVTASPQGEASGLCSPTRKSVPNQGTYMGPVIAQRPSRCAPPRQNERAGPKSRGSRGQRLRRSFLRLSPEKAGLPPGVGREPTPQV